MFKHSIKVPRIYKAAAKIAKDVSENKGSLKELVYKGIHPNIKALYALVLHTLQHSQDIENIFKKSKLLQKEPRFDPWLAKILVTELLWGKKRLAGNSKPEQTILAYEQIFKAHISDSNYESENHEKTDAVEKPRYVRINTLKISVNEAIDGFRDEGWILCQNFDLNDYNDFLEKISNLDSSEFCIDLHIPNLLIFPPKTEFYNHPAYKSGQILLQDKASCLPIHFLQPETGSIVLDMCAAPGMKTTQIAAMLENQGTVYAVEFDQKRFITLNKIVESSDATCVETINKDVLTLTEKQCPNVEYILVDPSCSGSGITNRLEFETDGHNTQQQRLQKLAGFQIKILRHALTRFPKVKRVVYSTCSLYPEENEDVVRQVLETNTNFRLVSAGERIKNLWNNFGKKDDFGEIGNRCLYARPEEDLTHGFFVAVFERLEDGERNDFLNKELYKLIKKELRQRNKNNNNDEMKVEENCGKSSLNNESDSSSKKRKAKIKDSEETDVHVNQFDGNQILDVCEADTAIISSKKKKKSKKYKVEDINFEENVDLINLSEPKKKNKKAKRKLSEHSDIEFSKDNEEALYTELEHKKKKHKKSKKVREKKDEASLGEVSLQYEVVEENLVKKKKKKKKYRETVQ